MRVDLFQRRREKGLWIRLAGHQLRGAAGGDDGDVSDPDESQDGLQVGGHKIKGSHGAALPVLAAACK